MNDARKIPRQRESRIKKEPETFWKRWVSQNGIFLVFLETLELKGWFTFGVGRFRAMFFAVMGERLNGWMDEWLNGYMVKWLNGWMVEWLNGWMVKWLNGYMVK